MITKITGHCLGTAGKSRRCKDKAGLKMKKLGVISAAVLAAACISCNGSDGTVVSDRIGRQVTINGTINRVVSTAPSNTEIIVDLGMAEKLIAVDVHSQNIGGIPEGTAFLDFFYPDAEAILGLKPDIIIANGHNATGSGEDPFRLLSEAGIPVVYISMSKSINDIYLDIEFIAGLLQAQKQGEDLIRKTKEEIAEITRPLENIENPKTVYFEISPPPEMMSFGKDSFIDDMISTIGAKNIFGEDSWLVTPGAEAVINYNPDIILTSVSFIDNPIDEIKSRPGFDHINAVINNRVYQIDNDSSSRPSARVVLALRQMAGAVYPELYAR